MEWKPVMINSEHKKTIQNIVNTIANKLKDEKLSEDISLMGGELGKGLYFSYLNVLSTDKQYEDEILKTISVWQQALNNKTIGYSLSNGLCGYIYYLNYLCDNSLIERDDIDSLINQLIELSFKFSEKAFNNNNFDFLHGGLGLAVSISRHKFDNHYLLKDYFNMVIQFLVNKQNYLNTNNVLWLSKHHVNNRNVFNIGLAHGNPSVINILTTIYNELDNKEQVKNLIANGINGILSQYDNTEDNISSFPNFIDAETMKKSGNSRLAWCYGDLGVSITLIRAGILFSNQEWIEIGTKIGLKTCKRKDFKSTSINDSGLCHGTSGVALMYSRLYNYTENVEFKESAEFWYINTIKEAFSDNGCLNYKAWDDVDGVYKNDDGLLEGIAGIGLSLISSISKKEPTWDRCLLLS